MPISLGKDGEYKLYLLPIFALFSIKEFKDLTVDEKAIRLRILITNPLFLKVFDAFGHFNRLNAIALLNLVHYLHAIGHIAKHSIASIQKRQFG